MNCSIRRIPQALNISLAFIIFFSTGTLLSMGVFTVPIETQAPQLRSVWSSTVGLVSLFSAPVMILTGFLLDERKLSIETVPQNIHPLTNRLRLTAFPVAFAYVALLLAVPAIRYSSPWLLRLAILPNALPWGHNYLVGIQVLLAWFPVSPPLAMSLVSAAFGSSQFVLSPILSFCIEKYGLEPVLVTSALVLFSVTLIILLSIRFPTVRDGIVSHDLLPESNQDQPLIPSQNTHRAVSWNELFRCTSFYQYMAVLALGRVAYACLPYFFKLGAVYGASRTMVVTAFQMLSACAVGYSICSNLALDVVSRSKGRNLIRSVLVLVFLTQALMFAILIPLSQASSSGYMPALRLAAVATLIVTLESHTVYGVILARDVFGVRNCAVVYGFAGGLAIGVSESSFTFLVSYFETRSSFTSSILTFVPYYLIGCTACVIGAALASSLKQCAPAFAVRQHI